MAADFTHPHWAFIVPAYAAALLVLGYAIVAAVLRLRRAERASRQADGEHA